MVGVPLTGKQAVMVAGLLRAAVVSALDAGDQGVPEPRIPAEVVSAASWHGAHLGVSSQLVELRDPTAAPELRPARVVVEEFLRELTAGRGSAEVQRVWLTVAAVLDGHGGAALQRRAGFPGWCALLDESPERPAVRGASADDESHLDPLAVDRVGHG